MRLWPVLVMHAGSTLEYHALGSCGRQQIRRGKGGQRARMHAGGDKCDRMRTATRRDDERVGPVSFIFVST